MYIMREDFKWKMWKNLWKIQLKLQQMKKSWDHVDHLSINTLWYQIIPKCWIRLTKDKILIIGTSWKFWDDKTALFAEFSKPYKINSNCYIYILLFNKWNTYFWGGDEIVTLTVTDKIKFENATSTLHSRITVQSRLFILGFFQIFLLKKKQFLCSAQKVLWQI